MGRTSQQSAGDGVVEAARRLMDRLNAAHERGETFPLDVSMGAARLADALTGFGEKDDRIPGWRERLSHRADGYIEQGEVKQIRHTKCWLAIWRSNDSHHIVGLFSSAEAATEAAEKFDAGMDGFGFTDVEELTVDGESSMDMFGRRDPELGET
jgi:hypothetical protein